MCGGFSCSKNALAFLNVIFLLVSFLLIGVASYAKAAAVITSIEIAGGIIASGLFLFLVAFLGLIAGAKHHQVLLFFYIILLLLLFIIQFSISIACLVVSESQVNNELYKYWPDEVGVNGTAHDSTVQHDAQHHFSCCGWDKNDWINSSLLDFCLLNQYCEPPGANGTIQLTSCKPCGEVIPKTVDRLLEITGGIGLFFSFTEMLGVWLAVRFRNQKNPSDDPNQFI